MGDIVVPNPNEPQQPTTPTHPSPSPTPSPSTPSTSTSSSSSSSAPAPKIDPRIAQLESLFRSAYTQLWGEPPTEDYVKKAAHSGMNVTEFIHQERMKVAFQDTKPYKDEAKGIFAQLRQMQVI